MISLLFVPDSLVDYTVRGIEQYNIVHLQIKGIPRTCKDRQLTPGRKHYKGSRKKIPSLMARPLEEGGGERPDH